MTVVTYSMTPLASPLSLLSIFTLVHLIRAQCVTDGYVPCLPAGSDLGGIPEDDFADTELWANLQETAVSFSDDDLAKLRRDLASRQDALCCAPTDKCLVVTDSNTPFCYVSTRKEFFFFLQSETPRIILLGTFCANLLNKKGYRHNQICLLG